MKVTKGFFHILVMPQVGILQDTTLHNMGATLPKAIHNKDIPHMAATHLQAIHHKATHLLDIPLVHTHQLVIQAHLLDITEVQIPDYY